MRLLLAFALIVPLACCRTQERGSPDWQAVECIEEIGIPRYGWVARLALKTGTVRVQIKIGGEGQISDVTVEAPDPRLADEVRAWVKQMDRFRPSCAGSEVSLMVTFRLEGKPTHYPFEILRFRPPNHFIVISQPRLPHILYMPVEPPKKGEKRGGP